jgi:membrane-bound lytic murein transglycosylase C
MLISTRIILILLTFILATAPIHANHKGHPHHHDSGHEPGPISSPKIKTDKELIQYNKEILQAYNNYREKAAEVWGENNAVVPDAKRDVVYRNNLTQRSIVDYEQGTVNVELSLNDDITDSHSYEDRLAHAIEQAILEPPDERSIIDIAEHPEPPPSDKSPALEGMVANQDGSVLTTDALNSFKKHQARRMKRSFIIGRDGKKRVLISTQFHLVPDHIKKRAIKFRDAVDRNAALHRIPAPLIYAIIETESSFNPRAKSHIPAFGLMQLVPKGGARDAYKYLFRKDKVVKESYLYKPNKNIELGVAYLHLLYFRHFKHIRNHESRQWAAIAAYNTGAQNVIKSFSGEYTKANYPSRWSWKSNALKQINSMKPEEVYNYLRKYLPAEETRNYIHKIKTRMVKYST